MRELLNLLWSPASLTILITLAGASVAFALDKTERYRPYLLAVLGAALSLTLSFLVTNQLSLVDRIKQTSWLLDTELDPRSLERFRELVLSYDRNFSHAVPVVRDWSAEALGFIQEDMKRGRVSLPWEIGSNRSLRTWDEARRSVFATNVGGTSHFFSNVEYIDANRRAVSKRNVVIVRFFLFSGKREIRLHANPEPRMYSEEEFRAEVKKLSENLLTLYAGVVNLDKSAEIEDRDLLLVDNQIVAELRLDRNWSPVRSWITQNDGEVQGVRDYVARLRAASSGWVMSDENVKRFFPDRVAKARLEGADDEQLALLVLRQVMAEMRTGAQSPSG